MQPTGKAVTVRMGKCSQGLDCKDWQREGIPAATAQAPVRGAEHRVRCSLQEGHLHGEGLAPVPGEIPHPRGCYGKLVSSEKASVRGRLGNKRGSCRLDLPAVSGVVSLI